MPNFLIFLQLLFSKVGSTRYGLWSKSSLIIVSHLLWLPVFVPQITGGFVPDGLVTVNLSVVQVPVVGATKTAWSKSNLTWQISEKNSMLY